MDEPILTKTRIQAGTYEAVLTASGDTAPRIGAFHLEQPVGELSVTADADAAQSWAVTLHLPADILTDGIQTILISDLDTGATLDSFTIVTGEPLSDDIRAEVDLLRAELDMLKKAFRRHCVDTASPS